MITRKSKIISTTAVWPYTPDPSPPLSPASISLAMSDGFNMSTDDLDGLRPISIASRRDGPFSPGARPTLDDVLNNRAPSPYSLAAYTAFLSQQHCLETLEFVTEAKKYNTKYYENAAHLAGMPFNTDSDEGYEMMQDWCRLLDIYVKPGAPREINLPAEERDDLIDYPYEPKPPPPEALDPAVKRMYDLMSDSIFIPFCNSLKSASQAHLYSAGSTLSNSPEAYERHLPSTQRRANSRRRRSPQKGSPILTEHPRSSVGQHRTAAASALTAGLTRTSSNRLSTHISHSSVTSEGAWTDDSSAGFSPSGGDHDTFTSPPVTPPQSDIPARSNPHQSSLSTGAGSKPVRQESGGWKKISKMFGGKKKS